MSEGKAIKLLDDLMVLFNLYEEDYGTVEDSLQAIADYRERNRNYPITLSLYKYMAEEGYLDGSLYSPPPSNTNRR